MWVGSSGGMEADLVKREGIRFEAIPAAGVHGVGVRALPGNLWQLGRGFFSSRRILRKFRPEVLFFTGGFVAVPMALAARISRRYKSLLYVPDIEPGQALENDCPVQRLHHPDGGGIRCILPQSIHLRWSPATHCDRVWISGRMSRHAAFLHSRSRYLSCWCLAEAKAHDSINQALAGALPELLQEMQVIHITGKLDWQMMEQTRAKSSHRAAKSLPTIPVPVR